MLPETQISIPDYVLSQKLDDETVLLNVQTGAYFGLTPVASRAWDLLQARTQPKDVPKLLAAEFNAPCDQIENDLDIFFSELRDRDLVTY